MSETAIEEARRDVVNARLRLADVIRANCPGLHRYVQHRDMAPPWCPACGYTQDGAKAGVFA